MVHEVYGDVYECDPFWQETQSEFVGFGTVLPISHVSHAVLAPLEIVLPVHASHVSFQVWTGFTVPGAHRVEDVAVHVQPPLQSLHFVAPRVSKYPYGSPLGVSDESKHDLQLTVAGCCAKNPLGQSVQETSCLVFCSYLPVSQSMQSEFASVF